MSKRGLGKGLGALISGIGTDEGQWREIAVTSLVPNPYQPRTRFDASALDELTASIKEHGVLQPLVVRRKGADQFELIAGERRWRAAQAADLHQVPVMVMDLSDRAAMEIALIENLQRADLTPLETAAGLKRLAEAFELTHDELAQRVGMSRSAVTNALRLLQLPPSLQDMLASGAISAGHARALLGCDDPDRQLAIAERIVNEGLSVRAVEQLVQAGKDKPEPRKPQAPIKPPAPVARLGKALGTAVNLRQRGDKGAIEITFASAEERDRLLSLLAERLVR